MLSKQVFSKKLEAARAFHCAKLNPLPNHIPPPVFIPHAHLAIFLRRVGLTRAISSVHTLLSLPPSPFFLFPSPVLLCKIVHDMQLCLTKIRFAKLIIRKLFKLQNFSCEISMPWQKLYRSSFNTYIPNICGSRDLEAQT